jgi:hypothetical protein
MAKDGSMEQGEGEQAEEEVMRRTLPRLVMKISIWAVALTFLAMVGVYWSMFREAVFGRP